MGTGFSGSDWPKGAFFSSASQGLSVELESHRKEEAFGFVFQTESVNSNLLHPGLQPSTFCSPVLGEDTWTWQG